MPTKLTNDEAAWLRTHKETIERRNLTLKVLKDIIVFLIFALASFALTYAAGFIIYIVIVALGVVVGIIAFAFIVFAAAAIYAIIEERNEEYTIIKTSGVIAGFILGVILVSIYFIPSLQIAAYPMQMQVAYPHLTIIQNCTAFSLSAQGYLNGKPIGAANTTTCLLPQENNTEYQCSIANKSITCIAGSSTWDGRILNVSKRN